MDLKCKGYLVEEMYLEKNKICIFFLWLFFKFFGLGYINLMI